VSRAQQIEQPLRVLVKGSSAANWVSHMGGPRTDFTYARVIEESLLRAGTPVTIRNLAVTSEPVRLALKNWEAQVYAWSPDVVILHYGLFESVHLLLPRFLERHAHSLRGRPGRVRLIYRQFLLRPVWKILVRIQQQVDRVAPPKVFRRRADRFADDVEQLIRQIQTIGSPLVLTLDIASAGEKWQTWFPGIGARIELLNDALAEAVARIGRPNVRIFSTAGALSELVSQGHDIRPDGGHYTAAAHRALGAAVAAEILTWYSEQPSRGRPVQGA
jgi:hypothetical protein